MTRFLLMVAWCAWICIAPSLFSQTYKVYFGDLHQHSIHSWDARPGALKPADAFAYARNVADIDFMAISDHTNGLSASNYQDVRRATGPYENPDSQFVAIAGQELGSLGNGGYGHLNIFEPPGRADNASDTGTRFDLLQAYQYLIDNDLLGQFNHPTTDGGNSNFNSLELYEPVDSQINSLEVLNGLRSSTYEKFYLAALRKGWHVGAVGDQDNHAGAYGDQVSNAGDIYLTGVLAESLTKADVLAAIEARRTYAFQTSPPSDRMYLTEFTAEGHWMGETFDNADNVVEFKISAHAERRFVSVQLYKNGHLLERIEPNGFAFAWAPVDRASFGKAYYFLKLVQEDTDVLWSSPIWVRSPGEETEPEAGPTPIGDLRDNFPNGLPRFIGVTNVTIRGVATVGGEFGDRGPGYVQDSTGGIAVFGSNFVQNVVPGHPLEYEVTGVVSFFNGQTEFIPYSTRRLGLKSFPEPAQVQAVDILTNGEAFEGRVVQVVDAEIIGSFPPAGTNATLSLRDESGACALRIDGDTEIAGSTAPSGRVSVTGVVGQFDPEPPYTTGHQLLPRTLEDFEVATSVAGDGPMGPATFALDQNHPNPFNAGTTVRYQIPQTGRVTLQVFNVRGQLVRVLVDDNLQAGVYEAAWDGRDAAGRPMPSGVYVYRLTAGERRLVRKMVYLR